MSLRLRRTHGNAQSCTSTFIFGSFGASPAGEGTTTSSATNTTPRRREERRYRRRVMLAMVERDDAHVGVDVDADEYICGMDGKAREREKKREFFVCGPTERETIKKYNPFLETFLWMYFFVNS